jgi:hypothetical protein
MLGWRKRAVEEGTGKWKQEDCLNHMVEAAKNGDQSICEKDSGLRTSTQQQWGQKWGQWNKRMISR